MKQTIFMLLALIVSYNAIAQIDTTSFTKERQESGN